MPSGQAQQRARALRSITWIGAAINILLSAIKAVVGVITGSQALVADAVHSLSDLVTDAAILIGVRFWTAPPDENHPHGHGRIETLVTLSIALALAAVAAGMAWAAIGQLAAPQPIQYGWWALSAALLSLVVKEWLYQWTIRVGRRQRSSALIANAWHHRTDALSSIPVAAAVLGQQIDPALAVLDPAATLLVAALIAKAAWDLGMPAMAQLSDRGADAETQSEILALAAGTPGVRSCHALRSRHLGAGLAIDLHIQVDPNLSVAAGHSIGHAVKDRLIAEGPTIVDVLVHVEPGRPAEASSPATTPAGNDGTGGPIG